MTTERAPRLGIALAAILAIAFSLRVVAVSFGLPAVYNPDEVAIMNRAMGLWANGFNPHNFVYPSLYFYVLFVWEGLWFVAGRAVGLFGSLADFERSFFVDPTSIYIAGRLLSAICGVLTVWVTWRLGERLFGRVAGMAAAALLAVAPLAVRDAHYVKHDVPVTLLVALVHLVALSAMREHEARRRRGLWIVTGIVAGLAMSMHYYAVFVMAPVLVLAVAPAEATESAAARLSRALTITLVAAVAFAATSPFLLLDLGTAMRDIVANRQIVVDRAAATGGLFGSIAYYLSWLATDGVGHTTAGLALAGLLVVKQSGWRHATVALLFPAIFLIFLGSTVPASRYLNPILPFIAILAGAAVARMLELGAAARFAGAMSLAAAAMLAGALSTRTVFFLQQPDTRTEAAVWIEREIPPGASILIQPYSVPLRASRSAMVEALTEHLGDPSRASVKFQRQLSLTPYPAPSYRTIYLGSGGLDVDKIYVDPADFDRGTGREPFLRARVTYVVLKRYNVPDPAMAALSRVLMRDGRLLATFSPYGAGLDDRAREAVPPFLHNTDVRINPHLRQPGPIIEIWSIG